MAVEVLRHPSAWQCESCDCVNGIAPVEKWETKGVINPTRTCYRAAITARTEYLLSLYPHYIRGHLYESGGVADQPAIYLDAMKFLYGYINGSQN